MHDRRQPRLRERRPQPPAELVDGGQVVRLRALPLLPPATELAFHEPVGTTKIAEPDGVVVDRVDPGKHVDELTRARGGLLRRQGGDLLGRAQDASVDARHHVERCAVHLDVVAERECPGYRHVGVSQRGEHAVLPRHVVRGWQHVPQWRSSQHPVVLAVADAVRQVRSPAGDQLCRQREILSPFDVLGEIHAQRVEIHSLDFFIFPHAPQPKGRAKKKARGRRVAVRRVERTKTPWALPS